MKKTKWLPAAAGLLLGILLLFVVTSRVGVEDSLAELRKRPYPFDCHIERHGKLFFPAWKQEEQLRWLTELDRLTDAGATYALMEVAAKNDLLDRWDRYAIEHLPRERRMKLRYGLGYWVTQKYWRHTLETTPEGICILHLKDLRNGAECVFRAPFGQLPPSGKFVVSQINSDLTVKDGPDVDGKELFAVRRDAETNQWFETGSWQEVRSGTPAVTTCEEINNVPVCTEIVAGKAKYATFRVREQARKVKLGKLLPGDLLSSPAGEEPQKNSAPHR